MKAHIMIGISGSGKSTYVKEHATPGSVVVNNDSARRRFVGINPEDNLWDYYKFDKNVESQVKSETDALINHAFYNNKDLWIDNTNLTTTKNEHLKEFLEKLGYEVYFHNLNTSSNINTYLYRNQQRINELKPSVINDQYIRACINNYVDFETGDRVQARIALVDIDGTVADHFNERSPFDWSKVSNDRPRPYVIETLKALYNFGSIDFIQFLSGRESICYDDTMIWLQNVAGFDMTRHRLLMRQRKDNRKDVIIKSEIYENCIKDKYEIKFVFDDRNQVVDYWWDQKLPVFHVGDYRNVF